MKFDVVVGNPPFNEGAYQLYANFYKMAIEIGSEVVLIFPTSWQLPKSKNGLGLLNNKEIKNDPQIIMIDNLEGVFPGISGAAWTNIIHWRSGYDNGLNGKQLIYTNSEYPQEQELYIDDYLFGKPKELINLSNHVENTDNFNSIYNSIYLQNKFNLPLLYSDYPEIKNKIASNGKEKRLRTNIFESIADVFSNEKNDGDVLIYGLKNRIRTKQYIAKKYLLSHPNLEKWKVLVPKAVTAGFGEKITEPLIIGKNEGYTETFLGFGSFDTEKEAEYMKKYIKTKFTRSLLGVLKMTQDTAPDKWKKVPIQNFSINSDINWTKTVSEIDQQLYKKYNLSDKEIDFIESNVKHME